MRYKVRAIYVEAFRYGIDPTPDWFEKCVEYGWAVCRETGTSLRTHEGAQFVINGDWIVQGYNGIPYGVYDDDFGRLYEPCE